MNSGPSTLTITKLRTAAFRLAGFDYTVSEHAPAGTFLALPGRRIVVSPDVDKAMGDNVEFEAALRRAQRTIPGLQCVTMDGWDKKDVIVSIVPPVVSYW